jgi:hypothetical protein
MANRKRTSNARGPRIPPRRMKGLQRFTAGALVLFAFRSIACSSEDGCRETLGATLEVTVFDASTGAEVCIGSRDVNVVYLGEGAYQGAVPPHPDPLDCKGRLILGNQGPYLVTVQAKGYNKQSVTVNMTGGSCGIPDPKSIEIWVNRCSQAEVLGAVCTFTDDCCPAASDPYGPICEGSRCCLPTGGSCSANQDCCSGTPCTQGVCCRTLGGFCSPENCCAGLTCVNTGTEYRCQ